MAKREIRVSFFYSDQSVFDLLRLKHRLEGMMHDANDFYGKYRLRIDMFPFPYDYLRYKDTFVLSQQQGIKPDAGMDQLAADMRDNDAKTDALQRELLGANPPTARKAAIAKELDALRTQAADFLWRGIAYDGEYDFRVALGERFATDRNLKAYQKDFEKAPRLAIVFCEFIELATRSKIHDDVDFAGEFHPALSAKTKSLYKKNKKPVPAFEQSFVIIDVKHADWFTLAHEIAHGNGHTHPKEGGAHDLPYNSIYNYIAHGSPPSQVILPDADLASLERAYFVREKP